MIESGYGEQITKRKSQFTDSSISFFQSLEQRELTTIHGQQTTVIAEQSYIPYARQWIDEDDIAAVVHVLRSDWLTTGPKVAEFEQAVADFVGAKEGVAVNSGTAALHAAMYAAGIGPGDEVILSPMTFVATANTVVFQGGTPVFVDVEPDTLLIHPEKVKEKITPRTKAIIAVDYAGQPCDYDALREIAEHYGLFLIADACHSLGAEYKERKVGTLADLTVFSFHPVKHITTGEGGMVVSDNSEFAEKMRMFRNHGITRDFDRFVHSSPLTVHRSKRDNDQQLTDNGQQTTCSWYYETQDLGYNYRITDFQCALGISQLKKLPDFLARRRVIASRYDQAFARMKKIVPLAVREDVLHAYHLYVIRVNLDHDQTKRVRVFKALRDKGVGANVHYIPVHLHPSYQKRFRTGQALCPMAEAVYEKILSLPMSPRMTDETVERVISVVIELADR